MTVLGRCYAEALEQGLPDRVLVTRPPRARCGRGSLRVVAVRERERRTEWVLAYEDYESTPHDPRGGHA